MAAVERGRVSADDLLSDSVREQNRSPHGRAVAERETETNDHDRMFSRMTKMMEIVNQSMRMRMKE